MSRVDVRVPDVGVEGAVEVIEICVSIGDAVEVDSAIIVLESDKATVEVPCPVVGEVREINVKLGDKVSEGDLLLCVDEANDDSVSKDSKIGKTKENQIEQVADKGNNPNETLKLNEVPEFTEIDVLVPDLGGTDQVEVIEIPVSVGSQVEREEILVVLESDKATMEVPSTAEGELLKLNVNVGDQVAEGDVIATVRVAAEASISESQDRSRVNEANAVSKSPPLPDRSNRVSPQNSTAVSSAGASVHAGPAVRKFARELGVDLTRVVSSGRKNRILKEDLQAYIKSMVTEAQHGGANSALGVREVKLPDFSAYGAVTWHAMDKIQRLTAENMQTSWLTVPHVTQFDEADITNMEAFRKQQKTKAEERGLKLTPVAFLLKACAYALRELPQFNVSLDMLNHQVVQKDYVHIGLAVDTPNGLVVPVIRDVDKKSLWQLAEESQSLAAKAKDRRLTPSEMQGGCFTISSLGALGGTAFTPIVNTPEVAILGVSKAQYKPVFDGEDFTPKLMLPLSLSYDHRAVNGADAARFTTFLGRVLGDLRELLL